MKDKVEINYSWNLEIKINDLIHLYITGTIDAIHSYIDEKSDGANKWKLYYINFHLEGGQTINCIYNDRELWAAILKGLE